LHQLGRLEDFGVDGVRDIKRFDVVALDGVKPELRHGNWGHIGTGKPLDDGCRGGEMVDGHPRGDALEHVPASALENPAVEESDDEGLLPSRPTEVHRIGGDDVVGVDVQAARVNG
jgi:hypothetical protein